MTVLKRETQSLSLTPKLFRCEVEGLCKPKARTVWHSFRELLLQLSHFINLLKLWQKEQESFPVNLLCNSAPDPCVSLNHCLVLFAGQLVFTSVGKAVITCAKGLSDGSSENFLQLAGSLDFLIASLKTALKKYCMPSTVLEMRGFHMSFINVRP